MRLAAALLLALPLAVRSEPRPLRHDLRTDAFLTGAAVAAWIASEAAKGVLAPRACRLWCAPGPLDAAARDALVWSRVDGARHASDALAFAIVPVAAGAHQVLAARAAGDAAEGLVDVLAVAEAAALAADLDQLVKFAVGRQRPFVHHGNWREPDRRPDPDDNLSFYSGHTTLAFAVAAGAGTVSDLRGYPSAPYVWGVGLGLAAATGYLRIAADAHYLTDVLAGAAAGSALGVAVPRLMHGRRRAGGGEASRLAAPALLVVGASF